MSALRGARARRALVALAVLLLLASLAWGRRPAADAPSLREAVVRRVVVARSVEERGRIVPQRRTTVRCSATGPTLRVLPTGTLVREGDEVFEIDADQERQWFESAEDDEARAEVAAGRARIDRELATALGARRLALAARRLELATAERDEALSGLRPAEARLLAIEVELGLVDLAEAREEEARVRRLQSSGVASEHSRDAAAARLRSVEARMESLRAMGELRARALRGEQAAELEASREALARDLARSETRTARDVEAIDRAITLEEIQLRRAREARGILAARVAGAVARAPHDGVVVLRRLYDGTARSWLESQPGQHRWAWDSVADIVDPGSVAVELAVNEVDVGRLRPGLSVRLELPAHPGLSPSGRVTRVAELGLDRNDAGADDDHGPLASGVTQFPVRVEIEAKAIEGADLRPGMSVAARFAIEDERPRLLVPREAVARGPDGDRIIRRGPLGDRPAPVRGRPHDERWYEVLEGLDEGDTIVWSTGIGAPR